MKVSTIDKLIAATIFGSAACVASIAAIIFIYRGFSMNVGVEWIHLILVTPPIVCACLLAWYFVDYLGRRYKLFAMLFGGMIAILSGMTAGIGLVIIRIIQDFSMASIGVGLYGIFFIGLIGSAITCWITFPLGAVAGLLTNIILKKRLSNMDEKI